MSRYRVRKRPETGTFLPVEWAETEVAPEPQSTDIELLEDIVLDMHGQPTPDGLSALESVVDELSIRRAAVLVRSLIRKLGDCAAGHALQRLITGERNGLTEAAKSVGCSKAAILKAEKVILRRVTGSGPSEKR